MKIDFSSDEGSERIRRAFRRATRQAYWKHKLLGVPIVTSDENGNPLKIEPENIVVPDEFDESSSDRELINRMTNDYTVNAAIVYDLEDAKEEIDTVLELFKPDEKVDEVEFRIRIAHLYYHINTAWNQRNLTSEELEHVDAKQQNQLAQFPLDITPN